jgi:hypothetical protein
VFEVSLRSYRPWRGTAEHDILAETKGARRSRWQSVINTTSDLRQPPVGSDELQEDTKTSPVTVLLRDVEGGTELTLKREWDERQQGAGLPAKVDVAARAFAAEDGVRRFLIPRQTALELRQHLSG